MATTNKNLMKEVEIPLLQGSPYSKRFVLILTPRQREALTHILRDALSEANDTLGFIQSYPRMAIDSSTRKDGQIARQLIRDIQPLYEALEQT